MKHPDLKTLALLGICSGIMAMGLTSGSLYADSGEAASDEGAMTEKNGCNNSASCAGANGCEGTDGDTDSEAMDSEDGETEASDGEAEE